jgi:homoserine kinase
MDKNFLQSVTVFSPATVANVGCGFDVFAFALDQPGDEVSLSITSKPGVVISEITGSAGLPYDIKKNTVGVAVLAMLDYLSLDIGISISLHKKMPIKSGLGSSAASAVGGVFALNYLLQKDLPNDLLLNFAIEGEKISSGDNVHLDNTAACLYGGFVLVRSKNPVDIVSIPVPDKLHCVILHPKIEVNTLESRKLLPEMVSLSDATKQWGNTAAVIAALYESDFELLQKSIYDPIVETKRSKNIPYFKEVKDIALNAGSIGFGISGSGPAVFALAESKESSTHISEEISRYYHSSQTPFEIYVSKINKSGPKIIRTQN